MEMLARYGAFAHLCDSSVCVYIIGGSRALWLLAIPGLILSLLAGFWINTEWHAVREGHRPPSWATYKVRLSLLYRTSQAQT